MPAKARRCLACLAFPVLLTAGMARAQEDRNVSVQGQTWTGRIVDAEGKPLPGVEIWQPRTSEERLGRTEPRPVAVSGPDGLFTLPTCRGTVTACPAGWVPAEHHLSSSPSGEPVEIRLRPAARMAGRVVDEQGKPVPGLNIWARFAGWTSPGCLIEHPPQPCPGNPHSRRGDTDLEGRFVFEGLEPGWFEVIVLTATQQPTVRWQGVPGEGGRELKIVLPEKLVALEGRIVDTEGKPSVGARVSCSGVRSPEPALTDATGAFRFPRVAPGPQLLVVSHPDLGWIEKEVRIEGSPDRLDIRLPRASLIQGRIAGRDGSPVANPSMSVDSGRVEADSEGRFRFNIPVGEHVVRVDARNWVSVEKTITATGDPIELTLEMSRSADAFSIPRGGRSWSRTCPSCRGNKGSMPAPTPRGGSRPTWWMGPGRSLPSRTTSAATLSGYVRGLAPGEIPFVQATSEDGLWIRERFAGQDLRFHIPGLWPGTWTLTAILDGRKASAQVRILPGEKTALADVSFGED